MGRSIKEASAKTNLKRVSLELGGKSPFIIFDVDDETLQKAADDAAASVFGQQQSCCSCTRIYVHEKVHDKFVEKLKAIADSKVAGDPFDEKSTNGAITSRAIFERILDYIKSGKDEGARVVSGGQRVGNKVPYRFMNPNLGLSFYKFKKFCLLKGIFHSTDRVCRRP